MRFATRLDAATAPTQRLAALGIDLDEAAAAVEADGVRRFATAHEALLRTLAQRTAGIAEPPPVAAERKGHRT